MPWRYMSVSLQADVADRDAMEDLAARVGALARLEAELVAARVGPVVVRVGETIDSRVRV